MASKEKRAYTASRTGSGHTGRIPKFHSHLHGMKVRHDFHFLDHAHDNRTLSVDEGQNGLPAIASNPPAPGAARA
jgi:hypothetical protein